MSDSDYEGLDIGKGVIRELMRNAYDEGPVVALRELVQNSLDQYEIKYPKGHPKAGQPKFDDKQKIIIFEIDKLHRTLTGTDYATGIEPGKLSDFKRVGSKKLSGSDGKTVGDEVSSYTRTNTDIVGHKHVGKLSLAAASDSGLVEFRSNNGVEMKGEGGVELTLRLPLDDTNEEVPPWNTMRYAKPTDALPHIGLQVKIIDVRNELLNVTNDMNELSEWLGIRLARDKAHVTFRVVDTGEKFKLEPPEDLRTDGEVKNHPELLCSNGKYITCRIIEVSPKSPKAGKLGVYVKYYKVTTIPIGYNVTGWVNFDYLETTTGRSALKKDEKVFGDQIRYKEFENRIVAYCETEGFEKTDVAKSDKLKSEKDLAELFNLGMTQFAQLYEDIAVPLVGKRNDKGKKGDLQDSEQKQKEDKNWEKLENQKIEKQPPGIDNGNGSGVQVIPIGGGKKPDEEEEEDDEDDEEKEKDNRTGGGGTEEGGGKGKTTVNQDGGNRTVLTLVKKDSNRSNVKPNVQFMKGNFGTNRPTLFMDSPTVAKINLDRPRSDLIMRATPKTISSVAGPLVSKAIVEFQTRDKGKTLQEGFDMFENLMNKMGC